MVLLSSIVETYVSCDHLISHPPKKHKAINVVDVQMFGVAWIDFAYTMHAFNGRTRNLMQSYFDHMRFLLLIGYCANSFVG